MAGWAGSPTCGNGLARVVMNLSARGFTTRNKTFEATISVSRTDFEDDRLGIFGPILSELGGTPSGTRKASSLRC
jgi:phage major head subunit gpT-like protein